MRLSPRDPLFPLYLARIGLARFAAERYEDAVEWSKRSTRAGLPHAWAAVATSYVHLGRLDGARAAVKQLARHLLEFSVADIDRTFPSSGTDPGMRERYLDGLRKAGMKE